MMPFLREFQEFDQITMKMVSDILIIIWLASLSHLQQIAAFLYAAIK